MAKTKKTNKEISDIQEKQYNRLKRKAELGLTAYDGDDSVVYTYETQADKFKDEMIANECINNDKPVPRDVRQRLLAERQAMFKAQRKAAGCDDNQSRSWYMKECPPFKNDRAMSKNINPATGKEWTEEEKREVYGKPVDLSMLSHRQLTPEEVRTRLEESMRLGAIGVPLIDDRGLHPELAKEMQKRIAKIKTKYFATYQDYWIAQEKVRQQIEYKDEPVDLELEKKLVVETKWLKESRQQI